MDFLSDDEDYSDDEDTPDDLIDDNDPFNATALEARQTPCGQWTPATRPAPQKRPCKDFYHKQLTVGSRVGTCSRALVEHTDIAQAKIVCGGGGGCNTSKARSRTFTFGWSSAVAASWISAGFNVSIDPVEHTN